MSTQFLHLACQRGGVARPLAPTVSYATGLGGLAVKTLSGASRSFNPALGIAYYIPTVWKSGGTRPPPICVHGFGSNRIKIWACILEIIKFLWMCKPILIKLSF